MKAIPLILFIVVRVSVSAQDYSDRIFSIVTKETQSFIDSAKKGPLRKAPIASMLFTCMIHTP